MIPDTFRRYPRTLQEAFGPYTDHRVEPMPPAPDKAGTGGYFLLVGISLISACMLIWG